MIKYVRNFGLVLLFSAAVVALYIAVTIFQLIYQPDSIHVVGIVSDFLSGKFPLLSTDIDGVKDHIKVDPSLRLFTLVFIVSIALIGISSLMNALIKGGLSLLRFSEERQRHDT